MLGSPRLDADQVPDTTLEHLDRMLDEAEANVSHVAPHLRAMEQAAAQNAQINQSLERNIGQEQAQQQAPAPEPTPEPVVEQPTVQEQQPQEPAIDPEIAGIEPPQNLSEANQSNWKKLQERAAEYKKQAEEAEFLRLQLEQLKNQPPPPPQVPEDYEELKKFRAVWDTQNDPNFKSRFDNPIASAKENIYGILKKNGAPDDVIKSIEEAGGPDAVNQNWWKTQALDRLPLTDAGRLQKHLIEIAELKEGREKEVADAALHRDEYLQRKDTELVDKFYSTHKEIEQYAQELSKDIPWAQMRQVDPSASQQEQMEAMKHNQAVQQLAQRFNAALYPTNPKTRAEVAAAATAAHVLAEQLRIEQATKASIQSELKRLAAENAALKNAGRTPRQGPTPPNTIKSSSVQDRIKMNASDAIDLGLDEAIGA
jgi:hypothetical protein